MSATEEFYRPAFEKMGLIKPVTMGEEDDYDYEAAQKAGVKPDERGHMPDTYKKPNHITFSDESMYHGKDGNEGGHWQQLGEDRWTFTPGKTNLDNYSRKEMEKYFKEKEPGNVLGGRIVDRDHHVPLLASAIMDDAGNYQGMAIDHRANIPEEYIPHLELHEKTELAHMNNLIKTGMSPKEAYEKAHSEIATPVESASVEAAFGKEGKEKYDQVMRDNVAIAKEPSDRPRHPDAHTTKYALDEHSIPTLQLDVLGSQLISGPGAFKVKEPANENTNIREFTGDTSKAYTGTQRPSKSQREELSRREAIKDDDAAYRAAVEKDIGRRMSDDEWKYSSALQDQRLKKMWDELKGMQKEKPSADVIPFKKPE